jgi:hypothetical protein
VQGEQQCDAHYLPTLPPPSLQRDRLTVITAAGAPTAAILTELNSASAESTHCRCCLLASASTPQQSASTSVINIAASGGVAEASTRTVCTSTAPHQPLQQQQHPPAQHVGDGRGGERQQRRLPSVASARRRQLSLAVALGLSAGDDTQRRTDAAHRIRRVGPHRSVVQLSWHRSRQPTSSPALTALCCVCAAAAETEVVASPAGRESEETS